MRDDTTLALRPDLFGQLAATDPFHGRARRLYERGQVLVVNGNQADLRVGYDARSNPLDLKEVPIVSGYIPRVGDWVAIQYEAGHSGAPWVTGPSMAADDSEDTPGIGVFAVSSQQPADPHKSTVYFDEPASTWRGWNGAAWVDLGGGGGGLHNSLPDLQGGAAGEYYHLTASQWSALVGNMPFGPGAILYADASGHLAADADDLFWDAVNKQLLLTAGSAAAPSFSFIANTGDGFYNPAAGDIRLALQGVQRWQFGQHFFRGDVNQDGIAYLNLSNASTHTDAAALLQLATYGGGDSFVRFNFPGTAEWAFGMDHSDGDALVAAASTTLGTTSRWKCERTGVMWLYPHSPNLAADGEAAMDSAHETWRWRMGDMQCLGASLVDDARVSDATVCDSGGDLAEQAISTHTVQSPFSTSGNTVKVVAKGTARVNPKGEGGGASMHILFRIEGTDVLDLAFNAAQAQSAIWIHYEFSFEATVRGSTSWEISNVKAGYATWQQVGNPWPGTFTPTEKWYARDTVFTVSGDITTQVRCSISNGAPGGSYITVAKHQAGLEQT